MRSTRGERYRRRILAESRGIAIKTAKKVNAMLDNYVLARRGEYMPGKTVILWDRIFMALFCLVFLIVVIKLLTL